MFLIAVFLIVFIYYRGFRIVNFCRDYFLLGKERDQYIEQELSLIKYSQRANKETENEKNKIASKYSAMLMNYDSKISSKIMKLKIDNVYKKYNIINLLNNDLILHSKDYMQELVSKEYNKCLSLIIKVMQLKKKK